MHLGKQPFTPPIRLNFQFNHMLTYQCSKGHASTESDYCSECGTKIQTITTEASIINSNLNSNANSLNGKAIKETNKTITCPACTAPHEPNSGIFCEICGYNFSTGVHGEVPPIVPQIQVKEEKEQSIQASNSSPSAQFVEITITIDPSLKSPESPEPPNQPPIILRCDRETNLIGRCSEARGINPDIALDFDNAVSHRHAIINRQPDGSFTLRDIESANGTILNGIELNPLVDTLLKDGDEFTLGHWTRIKVKLG
jgi:FHA domain